MYFSGRRNPFTGLEADISFKQTNNIVNLTRFSSKELRTAEFVFNFLGLRSRFPAFCCPWSASSPGRERLRAQCACSTAPSSRRCRSRSSGRIGLRSRCSPESKGINIIANEWRVYTCLRLRFLYCFSTFE